MLVLISKFCWKTATSIHLCIVSGSFHTTVQSNCNGGHMAHKTINILYLALYRGSLPVPQLE